MARSSSFVISEFTNLSGEIVYRVSGWLDGRRVGKNIRTCIAADAERQVFQVQRL